jgi:hypothetical protein
MIKNNKIMKNEKMEFNVVRRYIAEMDSKDTRNHWIAIDWDIIDSCELFSLKYRGHGFAETDDIMSKEECYNEIRQSFNQLAHPTKTKFIIQKSMKNSVLKKEIERARGYNAGGFGRMVARLYWLIENEK